MWRRVPTGQSALKMEEAVNLAETFMVGEKKQENNRFELLLMVLV